MTESEQKREPPGLNQRVTTCGCQGFSMKRPSAWEI